jgi:hypothetical protein
MRKALIVAAAAAIAVAGSLSEPAHADSRGGAVAAGLIGGLAVGALVGAAAAQPRYYGPPPVYYAEPEPVYMAPPPPRCYWTRGEPAWDGYRGMWVRPRIQLCD